jgi:hypothetical protein
MFNTISSILEYLKSHNDPILQINVLDFQERLFFSLFLLLFCFRRSSKKHRQNCSILTEEVLFDVANHIDKSFATKTVMIEIF